MASHLPIKADKKRLGKAEKIMKNKIGTIEIGKWADIIAVDGHPDKDIELLGEPNNIRLAMKKGEIMKNTV